MKKKSLFILLNCIVIVSYLQAQTENDPIPIVSWTISERLGDITPTPFDTIVLNFQNRNIPDNFSTAYGYVGNLMLPGQSKIFFDRPEDNRFLFINGFYPFIKTPGSFNFTNTKLPYSNLTYTWGGGTQNKEERFSGIFSANANKRLNVGAYFDYVYARGFYDGQSAKQTNFVFFANYLSDKYILHAFAGIDGINYFENGGLADDRYITNPEEVSGSKRPVGSKEIPVNFKDEGARLKDRQFYLNHRYNVGFYREITDSTKNLPTNQIDALSSDLTVKGKVFENEEDSVGTNFAATERTTEFVPVTSFIHTFKYTYDSRYFVTESIPTVTDYTTDPATTTNFYPDPILNDKATNDLTRYVSIKNTFGISLLEGFNKYAKAGLSVFIENDLRNYHLFAKPLWFDTETPVKKYTENATSIGAELTKKQGKLLTYKFKGELGVLGDDLGQFKLSGDIQTQFRLWKDTVALRAYGYLYNLVPTFYQKNYHSNFFWWDANLSDQRKLRLGGVFSIPDRNISLDIGVENLQNYIYFDHDALPAQTSKNIQVVSAKLNYNFNYGILHCDNEFVYQTTSNKDILPLPAFSMYSNLYLWFKAAKVLQVQLGGDFRYNTKYYAPAYQPATSQFYLQNDVEIGNYPLINAYVNLYLKKTRFFVMAYHVNQSAGNYFSLPHYPINPFHLRFGVSASFND